MDSEHLNDDVLLQFMKECSPLDLKALVRTSTRTWDVYSANKSWTKVSSTLEPWHGGQWFEL